MTEREEAAVCPTRGPATTEPHPRRVDVTRCGNCKEHLTTATTGAPSHD